MTCRDSVTPTLTLGMLCVPLLPQELLEESILSRPSAGSLRTSVASDVGPEAEPAGKGDLGSPPAAKADDAAAQESDDKSAARECESRLLHAAAMRGVERCRVGLNALNVLQLSELRDADRQEV